MANSGRIAAKFRKLGARDEAALIPFVVAGDPELETTSQLVIEFERRGADLIELGVPFSDPMADGPANQRAAARGLSSGASLAAIFSMVKELRSRTEIPIVLFGYYNPIFHYGCERLAADAARAGVDGLLVVDLPPEEAAELQKPARKNGLDFVYLLAPTSPLDRARKIAHFASGFLYYVSVTGVTGARAELATDLEEHVRRIRGVTELPVGVGFGISSPAQAARVAAFADAVIVGSALSLTIEANLGSPDLVGTLGEMVGAMKNAMRMVRRGSETSTAR